MTLKHREKERIDTRCRREMIYALVDDRLSNQCKDIILFGLLIEYMPKSRTGMSKIDASLSPRLSQLTGSESLRVYC